MSAIGKKQVESPIWTSGKTDVYRTGTWRSAVPDYVNPPSPCHSACPVDGNIALWIRQTQEGDPHAAWLTLVDNNPFPAIAGRVCHHPCESVCNRRDYDGAVAICALERYVGDRAIEEGWSLPAPIENMNQAIAVIGGGPAGLPAAYQLRRRGYAVTLFEASRELGGLMRHGIPPYRLSRDVLDHEIQRIIDLGVKVAYGKAMRTPAELESLAGGFAAIYLAMGADTPKRLPLLDYGKPWVMEGAEYLALANRNEPPQLGRRIAVIGGGSAAMDVARSARRHGREVIIMSLEPEAMLPCQQEELIEARAEGIGLHAGSVLQGVLEQGDCVLLNCARVDFQPGVRRGEFKIKPVKDSGFTLEVDAIVTAIGQDPAPALLEGMLERNGALIGIDRHMQTSRRGIFAGGDLASMDRFVTHAIGMGKRAAGEIHRFLHPDETVEDRKRINRYRSVPRAPDTRDLRTDVSSDAINLYYHVSAPRTQPVEAPPAERVGNFGETRETFTTGQADAEAARCFSCGNCILCDNCFNYCPDMAILKLEQGYTVKPDFCKGCGLCVRECPTGAIAMFEDRQ
ncbi:MAG TPA: NAD(P)-binding protein [Gammaproteobacteria bacterium]|nr:NAD(P)-binding protein [Gammaproteobacteria bacterium]